MDEDDMYDEFGNYIGPEIESDSEEDKAAEGKEEEVPQGVEQVLNVSNEHRIVLHEDKKFYISHEEMYPGAEIMIEQEDRQSLETPLVSTEHEKCYDH
jgi:116 kDa U5 small nuclear ribonucleoprotein component